MHRPSWKIKRKQLNNWLNGDRRNQFKKTGEEFHHLTFTFQETLRKLRKSSITLTLNLILSALNHIFEDLKLMLQTVKTIS